MQSRTDAATRKEQAIRWDRGDADDGISLVEVLVAISVLAVVMAATASSVIQALQVARDSRESVIAANVVQYELERLRTIPFIDWVNAASGSGTATTTGSFQGPDGQAYEVTRRAQWVQAGAGTDGCESAAAGGDGADYVRVSQTVQFPGRDIQPVTNVTIISPRLAFFDPFTGNLSITVTDRDGNGAAGHTVTIQGAAGLEVAITDDNGCAFFAYLPVDENPATPSTYDVTIDSPGYVDPSGVQLIEDAVVVAIQTTTTREYVYDLAATVQPVPTLPEPPGCTVGPVGMLAATAGADPTTNPTTIPASAPAPTHILLGCISGGPPDWGVRAPLNLGHRLHNSALTFSPNGHRAFDPDDTVVLPEGVGSLFPYTDGYGVQAGRCIGSDPVLTGAPARAQAATGPGQTTEVTVPMALVTITAVEDDPLDPDAEVAVPDVEVFADTRDGTCEDGERLYLGRSGPTGTIRAALPFGSWVIHWMPVGTAPPAQRYACAEVPASDCTTLRADAAPDPLIGQVATAERRS
ncbi:MAG TPA: prepilin-type N-terminal cleavage/methylation domain-containing protein [Euzebya sp.]|nr:prepilin-type N-terminal cleavage/methylation domain-containing protein [Euzebya sp.]